jgi:hypothetical protein
MLLTFVDPGQKLGANFWQSSGKISRIQNTLVCTLYSVKPTTIAAYDGVYSSSGSPRRHSLVGSPIPTRFRFPRCHRSSVAGRAVAPSGFFSQKLAPAETPLQRVWPRTSSSLRSCPAFPAYARRQELQNFHWPSPIGGRHRSSHRSEVWPPAATALFYCGEANLIVAFHWQNEIISLWKRSII